MESPGLLDKLKRVERSINIYRDAKKEFIEEISINIPIEVLGNIMKPNDGDPMLYLGYILDKM